MVNNKLEKDIIDFILAGKAELTVLNTRTNGRFTFRVSCPRIANRGGYPMLDHDSKVRFVSVLSGPDNQSHYSYMGLLDIDSLSFRRTTKSTVNETSPSFLAFSWLIRNIKNLPDYVEIYHSGFCGRCGKKLTTPDSVKSGFGPECAEVLGIAYGKTG